MNNRPLTYRCQEYELEILTPNHLINAGSSFPSLILSEDNTDMVWDGTEQFNQNSIHNSLDVRDKFISKFRCI